MDRRVCSTCWSSIWQLKNKWRGGGAQYIRLDPANVTAVSIDSSLPFPRTNLAVNSPRNRFPKTKTIPVRCGAHWSHPHRHLAPPLAMCDRVLWTVCGRVLFQHTNATLRSGPWIQKKKRRLRSGPGFRTAYYIAPPLAIGSGGAILQISDLFVALPFEQFLYSYH